MMHTSKFSVLLLACTASLGLVGCAGWFNPIGEEKFDCNRKQDPNSPYCRSFKAVEAGTAGELPPSRFDREFRMSDSDRLNKIAPDGEGQDAPLSAGARGVATGPLPHQVTNMRPLDGQPIREAGVVQKVVIYTWRDGNDTLHEGEQTVFKEIIPARWAGFSAKPQDNARTGVYPHRLDDPATTSAAPRAPAPSAKATPAQQQPNTAFVQPGSRAATPDVETAPASAESGANSMPE